MAESTSHNEIMTLTTEIVAAHVANNSVAVADLPDLIQQVYRSLTNAGDASAAEPPRPQPAVSIKAVGKAGLNRLSGGRQEAEDAETPSQYRITLNCSGVKDTS